MTAPHRIPRSRSGYRAGVALAGGSASVIVWLIAALAGARLIVSSPLIGTLTIDLLLVIVTAFPVAVAAWGALTVIERLTARPRVVWTAVASAVLVLSLPPLALLDATPVTTAVLGLMHVATGVVLILLLPRGAVSTSRRSAASSRSARGDVV
ncbi:DUF6069 family protein [Microbacterium ulmi]|uniref:Uncharacterized protein n=1 Tax=Microbacterium ulmi TaxID=179095 RepID=A0A7Y2LXY5_9MICO|nr:hypothetical protein [Microbacterium ulmi]NNH02657.1 hypothetical protein [Microbacterium ulmi]